MEIFKDIKGYEGIYQISNLGNVRSLDRQTKKGFVKGKQLKVYSKPKKYNRISLEVNGIKKTYTIHRLVATAFIPNPENKPQVNHIDGNKQNSIASNLEWATLYENMKHAFDTGLLENVSILKGIKGDKHPCSKLDDLDVLMIRCLSKEGFSHKLISEKFKVHQTHIGKIINLKSR